MYSTTQLHTQNQFSFPASYEDSAPIRDEAHIATLYQATDFVRSDPNPNTSVSGHSNSPDIDFNVQLSDDTMHTAYPEDFPNLSPPSQGPSSYWGWSDSDSQCSSSVPDSEINIEEQLLINTLDSLYNVLLVTISTQQHLQLLCPDCQEWVQTSVSSQLPLWYPGQFSSLSSHRGSCKCMKSLNEKTIQTVPNAPLSHSLSLMSKHSISESQLYLAAILAEARVFDPKGDARKVKIHK
ncbi:hypothetical protein BD769DRAFT_1391341 [Suillus cothurnatus]|nr:hypothetical protein BD769DRAFT_1391341 [Suillus cothurnatus]